jgi:spore germination protein YaaH
MVMTKDNRRIITWTHIDTSPNYRNDIEKYNHKIYSIGLHEFGVRPTGKIYNYATKVDYFDANGNHTGTRFSSRIEEDMMKYRHIKWFFQMIVFGWSTVKPFLDNTTINEEGRTPQDQFILELGKLLDLFKTSRYSNEPLPIDGIEMDVEATMSGDPYSQGYDVKYINLLKRIKNEVCIPRGLRLRTNSYAMWGDNTPYYYRFHNYKLFAESTDKNGNPLLDEVQIMTYDFAWSGSSPGASTPLWWFENVAEWANQCFDPKNNPKAKLTIDNVFFGAAGYGNRWGIHDQSVVKRGTNVTYHQMLGWQNGHFKHYTRENGVYVYHDQPYIYQTAFQDEESKNEVMYPHVYDRFVPKYAEIKEQNGGSKTATVGTYNRLDYATSFFKDQHPIWTDVKAIATKPSSTSGKARRLPDSRNPNIVKTVDGQDYEFEGYYPLHLSYVEKNIYDPQGNVIGAVCELEDEQNARINYNVNIPSAGNYKLIAITNFSWYTEAKLGGYVNGSQRFNIGGDDIPEWFPFILKGSFFYDCGTFNFNSGTNTISVHGELCDQNTPIYGFVVCQDFDQNFSGGEMKFKTNITPFKGKDGKDLPIPKKFAIVAKMLRRDARPAILWDDEFRTYPLGDNIAAYTYYRQANPEWKVEGGGTHIEQTGTQNGQPVYKCYSEPRPVGYSKGEWISKDDGTGRIAMYYNSRESGQCILSKPWSVNLSIESRIKLVRGSVVGIRFYAQRQGTVGDGYIFRVNLPKKVRELVYEDKSTGQTKVIASQPLGNIGEGDTITFRALLYKGVGRFEINGVRSFVEAAGNPVTHDGSVDTGNGNVTLQRTSGACGIYANDAELYVYHLGIGTLDRWETLEKFEITIDGETKEFGRINRTGYSYDEYGYLIYSGLDETVTRDDEQYPFEEDSSAVSLDYEMTVFEADSWQGEKEITLKLVDAGVWFGELLIGDREGMSIIWAGDAWSILEVMNLAVDKYGAKGIGLWAMGQEDPKIWEMIPDVVPKS